MKRPAPNSPSGERSSRRGFFIGRPVSVPVEVKDDAEKLLSLEPGGFPQVMESSSETRLSAVPLALGLMRTSQAQAN